MCKLSNHPINQLIMIFRRKKQLKAIVLGAAGYAKTQVHRECLSKTAQVLSVPLFTLLNMQAGQVRPAPERISPFLPHLRDLRLKSRHLQLNN